MPRSGLVLGPKVAEWSPKVRNFANGAICRLLALNWADSVDVPDGNYQMTAGNPKWPQGAWLGSAIAYLRLAGRELVRCGTQQSSELPTSSH